MARRADPTWDTVEGLDLLLTYKTDRAAYTRAAEALRLGPGEVMLVTAHNEYLQARQEAGRATAFVLSERARRRSGQ